MREEAKVIIAVVIGAVLIAGIMASCEILQPPTPPETALGYCAKWPEARNSPFCMKLLETKKFQ